ncbi:hypothetical protein BD309DRAFT_973667 [Dichomitus squalens]|nr:hypothetical protein BD309DRAFT_973667 [Dichomitus squalens]
MASTRHTPMSDPSSSKHSANASTQKPTKRQHPKKHSAHSPSTSSSPTALPGVQKIKAALRQTRRLLAKDSLAANVRVKTERRLKSLEADLAKAEQARVERSLAARYHKVKFFERQKLLRKIAQVKRQLKGDGEDGEGETLGKKERKKLEKRLGELRVDLNYVLHYPKTKKYISLFPPEVRKGEEAEAETVDEKGKAETDGQREEIRAWVREQMEGGALSSEPEVEVGKSERGRSAPTAEPLHPTPSSSTKQKKAGDCASMTWSKPAKGGVADDEFFGADDEENEDESAIEEGPEEDSEMGED